MLSHHQYLQASSQGGAASGDHSHEVKFDEDTIAEHDKDRGTRTKITEPKTPYEASDGVGAAEEEESSGGQGSGSQDVEMQSPVERKKLKEIDMKIKHHLEEAERNKLLNAQLAAQKPAELAFNKELQAKLD